MDDWWKAPILQGDDNMYGEYDWMLEQLPHDEVKWCLERYPQKCDSCGKESHLYIYSEHFFHCWDGWDSMSFHECWRCDIKDKICGIKRKFKLKIETFTTALELYKSNPKRTFKHYYELAKKIVR